ncbi:MAG: L-threonylcarbamoyladenylate synthase [Gammaproteobacteria bacterium]|nr:L-threonylcarbamoyladenylate synthase [Gammaproteobacteria bacterium]
MIIQSDLMKAVEILRKGGLIALPTETVYGLGADASNPEALLKIFTVKQRPIDHPLIVHLADIEQLPEWVSEIPDFAMQLGLALWPGPMTLIFKKAPHVSDLITGKQDTIAVRVPAHPIAEALLRAFGGGVAAPSANLFGRLSPTTAAAVREELGDQVDFILDGGQCEVGVESTIIDVSRGYPVILRPGMITAHQIESILNEEIITALRKNSPRVSGSMASHYAPRTKMRLMKSLVIPHFLNELRHKDLPIAILTYSMCPLPQDDVEWIMMPNNPLSYAHDLYQTLRDLDKRDFREIIIETPPEDSSWDAIRDRLVRASHKE